MNAMVELWEPVEGNLFVSHSVWAKVKEGPRSDFEVEGRFVPGGTLEVALSAAWSVTAGWYVVVGGVQYRIEGVKSVLPWNVQVLGYGVRNSDQFERGVPLTLGSDDLTIGGTGLVIGGGSASA